MVAASRSLALGLLAVASQALYARAWVLEPSDQPQPAAAKWVLEPEFNATEATVAFNSKISLAATTNTNFVGVAPVYGFPNCDFSMALSLNGQSMRLLLDTGSSNNAVAGSACTQCTTDGIPKLYTDNTGQAQTKTINPHYGDGSFWNGYITTGVPTTLPGGVGTATTTSFGSDVAVMTSESKFFNTVCAAFSQGILGLAYARLAQSGETTFPDSLAAAGMPNGFAFQLCAISNNLSPTQRVGSFYLGGFPSSQLASPMLYTPVKTIGYYEVSMTGMSMGTTDLGLNNLATDRQIVDSGTTNFLLPSDNYQKVVAAIQAASPISFTGLTAAQTATTISNLIAGQSFTTLASNVQLSTAASAIIYISMPDAVNSGQTIKVPLRPQDYIFVTAPDSAGKVTFELLFQNGGTNSGTGAVNTIIGLPAHMNKVVFYDRAYNRVGFANAVACQYSSVQGDVTSVTADKIDVLPGGLTRSSSGSNTGTNTGSGTSSGNTGGANPSPSPSSASGIAANFPGIALVASAVYLYSLL